MTRQQQKRILNILLIYVLLQPIFDILSFLSIREIIPFNISTYIKPIFVFSLGIYMLFWKCDDKKKWYIYILVFLIFLIGHFYVLFSLLTPLSKVLHEFRFIINIAYMIALFIIAFTLYNNYDDKTEFLTKVKHTVLVTILLYFVLLIISVLTGTASLTYEYADAAKKGFKGWFDSGQILGHAFSILFPILIYVALSPKSKIYTKVLILSVFVTGVSLLGTKVPYYITIIVMILYFIISIIIPFLNKEHKVNYFNLIIIPMFVIIMFATYKYTPVYFNNELNKSVLSTSIEDYDLNNESGYAEVYDIEELKKLYPGKNIDALIEYYGWSEEASDYLSKMFKEGKVHPSDMRKKQILYANKKYSLSDLKFKLFGLGFLNQDSSFSLESDFFMALYSFGIFGFILFLVIPLYYFIKSTIFILKNLKLVDFETYLIYMGLGIFFCISIYAGYTYIYTNFSIFLVLLIVMLRVKIDKLNDIKNNVKRKIKSIDFLVLHLGYGGIESTTINSANALCSKYDVNIISFYNLSDNQEAKIDKRIDIKHLYDGEPNKDSFMYYLKKGNLIGIFKEGIIAISILIKKKALIIKYIKSSKSDAIVSTRIEFNLLLDKYGKSNVTKIAQEHHYHNGDKKYINKLKKYHNIDYLFALTKTLENDYKRFLLKNKHTKVVLVPNMICEIPNISSNLEGKNIITVSRLDYGKRNDAIIKAFSKIKAKDWKLYIIGDGKEFENLKLLINELKLENRVILTGYKDKKEIERYMLKSSLFLMASETEGLPMVLLEAMSYGIPCIAYETASGINDIIISDKNGYVVKDRNEEEYISKINQVIDNEQLRKKLGKNAKDTAYQFSEEKILKIWYDILKEV